MSIATLAHQFTSRERLLGVMAGMFGTDLSDTRVWLAWVELGRSDPGIAARVAHLRGQERLLLDAVLGRRFDPATLNCAHAMVDGLRAAVCAGDDSVPVERARSALQLGLSSLGGGT